MSIITKINNVMFSIHIIPGMHFFPIYYIDRIYLNAFIKSCPPLSISTTPLFNNSGIFTKKS